MNTILIIIFTLILISFIFATIYVLKTKKLEYYKIRVDEAEGLIIEELNRRYEDIMKTESIIQKSTKKKIDFYKELEKVKKSQITSYEIDVEITKAIKTINTIINDYNKLKENKKLKEIMRDLEQSNTTIIAAKSFYNTNATSLNELIRKFPYNLLAKIGHISVSRVYESEEFFNELEPE